MTERFKVVSVTGYPIHLDGHEGSSEPGSDYAVLDTAINHRIVKSFRAHRAARGKAHMLAHRLEQECAGLPVDPPPRKRSVFRPTCPKCGEFGRPGGRLCEGCGARLV